MLVSSLTFILLCFIIFAQYLALSNSVCLVHSGPMVAR